MHLMETWTSFALTYRLCIRHHLMISCTFDERKWSICPLKHMAELSLVIADVPCSSSGFAFQTYCLPRNQIVLNKTTFYVKPSLKNASSPRISSWAIPGHLLLCCAFADVALILLACGSPFPCSMMPGGRAALQEVICGACAAWGHQWGAHGHGCRKIQDQQEHDCQIAGESVSSPALRSNLVPDFDLGCGGWQGCSWPSRPCCHMDKTEAQPRLGPKTVMCRQSTIPMASAPSLYFFFSFKVLKA